jgi:hypothetical protein
VTQDKGLLRGFYPAASDILVEATSMLLPYL